MEAGGAEPELVEDMYFLSYVHHTSHHSKRYCVVVVLLCTESQAIGVIDNRSEQHP